jgi:glycosyltransferase involved in cell wall biosynthesis
MHVKIVQVCPRYYPDIGGVETHVREISERLVQKGFDVEVVCTDPTGRLPKYETINGVRVIRFRSFAPDDAYYFAPQIYFYLKSHICDLIHAHSYHALPAIFASLAKGDRKLVFTPHYHRGGHTPVRDFLHKIYRPFGSRIFDRADKVVCVSEYEQGLVMSDFGVPEWKILEIVGKGPYENDLHELADTLGVSEHIGWQSDVTRDELLQQYASADVFLMLSTHEAYGITVAEALAAGMPCVVARGSALAEFVDGERCIGIVVPITVDKLVEAIQRLKNVEQHFGDIPVLDWNDVTDRLINVYGGLQ